MANYWILIQDKGVNRPQYSQFPVLLPKFKYSQFITFALKLSIVFAASYFSVKWILNHFRSRKKRKKSAILKHHESQVYAAHEGSSYLNHHSPYQQINTWQVDETCRKKSNLNRGSAFSFQESYLTQKIVRGPVVEDLVEATTREKAKITAMIKITMDSVTIKEIKKVQNIFLEAMYLLKKEEYKLRTLSEPEEKVLIHVTGVQNVYKIIRDNFDWRKVIRGKFGDGTSFSDDAEYANKYANKHIGNERAFIITKVLVSQCVAGSPGMKVPPGSFDTATGNGSSVTVKFCDYEVLPLFVVYYNTRH